MNRLIRSIFAAGIASVALAAAPALADQGRTQEHPIYTQAPTQLAQWRRGDEHGYRDHERARVHQAWKAGREHHGRSSRNDHRRWGHSDRDGHGRWYR